jgi:hypothetical protein
MADRKRDLALFNLAIDETELAKVKKRLRQIVDAIAEGVAARTLKDELLAPEAREDVLRDRLDAATPENKVLLNPNMSGIYRAHVSRLHEALGGSEDHEAFEAIRSLIQQVVVTPGRGKPTIDLHGQIAAILNLTAGKKAATELGGLAEQLVVVAGARSSPLPQRGRANVPVCCQRSGSQDS